MSRWIVDTDKPNRLIAVSHLSCVVTFGVLLFKPWHEAGRLVEAAIAVCFGTFCAAAIAIAAQARGLHRAVFGAFGALALLVSAAEAVHLVLPHSLTRPTIHAASDFELAVLVAALNVLLALYAVYYAALQRSEERRVGKEC